MSFQAVQTFRKAPPPGRRINPTELLGLPAGATSEIFQTTPFWKGMVFGAQGTACRQIYIVCRGQVLLSGRGQDGEPRAQELLGPGDLFGEGGLQPGKIWLRTASAVTDGEAFELPTSQIPRLAQYYPQITEKLLGLLGARLSRATQRLDLTANESASERVQRLLVDMARRHGQPVGDEVWLPVRLTQTEMGQMVGLARETVARVLADLETTGAIRRFGRNGIWLRPSLTMEA